MQRTVFCFVSCSLVVLAIGCTCSARSGPSRVDGSLPPGVDGGRLPPGFDGSGPVNPCAPGCGPEESCGGEGGDGNGLDDDCDGRVDEGCTCAPGSTRPCFAGTPERRDIGACADGLETCTEFGIWSACTGGVSPSAEACNGADDDCNGIADDGLAGCTVGVTCPSNEHALPLASHTLRGARVYPGGDGRNWVWGIECPSSVPADLCPRLSTPNQENTDVYFAASGAYRVTASVTLPDGSSVSCAWTVYVQGGGLRVELNWDTMPDTRGGTDVDLHLHRWTRDGVDTAWFEQTDDCYYANCQPDDTYSWPGHADSDLENCQDAAHGGGADWRARGACRNPRLDVDTNGTDGACRTSVTDPNDDAFCAPENINVDTPIIGQPYRIMVNYYNDHGYSGPTYPSVNIFCGGALRGAFGLDPIVTLRNGDGFGGENDNWVVADVVFFEGACGLDCHVYPISQMLRGMPDPSDPFGFTSIVPFGDPWSCHHVAGSTTCTE